MRFQLSKCCCCCCCCCCFVVVYVYIFGISLQVDIGHFEMYFILKSKETGLQYDTLLGPVVQSVVSLTNSYRVISLTVLADSIYNILIFFAEKM